jgi:hypothetical protein
MRSLLKENRDDFQSIVENILFGTIGYVISFEYFGFNGVITFFFIMVVWMMELYRLIKWDFVMIKTEDISGMFFSLGMVVYYLVALVISLAVYPVVLLFALKDGVSKELKFLEFVNVFKVNPNEKDEEIVIFVVTFVTLFILFS